MSLLNEPPSTGSANPHGRALAVSGIAAGYTEVDVLRGLDIAVGTGEMLGLLGRNGAGKTTFLSAVSGTVRVRRGSIVLFERDITRAPAASRVRMGIGHVPQGRRIIHGMSVRENLLVGGFIIQGRRKLLERMEEVLREVPLLARLLNRDGQSLSGGQQQLLALGRALMCNPKVLLLDEPLTGLSPIAANQVMELLVSLSRAGLAILVVEQNARMVMQWCDRIAVLYNGRVGYTTTDRGPETLKVIEQSYLGTITGSSTGGRGG